MKQSFTFASDQSAEVTFRLAVDAALLAVGNQKADAAFCNNDMLTKDGVSGTITRSTEAGDLVCTISVSGPMARVVEAISETRFKENGEQYQGLTLSADGEGYTLRVNLPAMETSQTEDEHPMAQTMQAMMLAKMSGRSLAWSVRAPKIIATSGTISEDATVATYSRPLAEAFTSKEPTQFYVTFSLQDPSLFGRFKSLFQ